MAQTHLTVPPNSDRSPEVDAPTQFGSLEVSPSFQLYKRGTQRMPHISVKKKNVFGSLFRGQESLLGTNEMLTELWARDPVRDQPRP